MSCTQVLSCSHCHYDGSNGAGVNRVVTYAMYKIDKERKTATLLVELTKNEILHLKKGDFYQNEGRHLTETDEKNICLHERGHQTITRLIFQRAILSKVIPIDIQLEGNNAQQKEQLDAWGDTQSNSLRNHFSQIIQDSKDFYHDIYLDYGSPKESEIKGGSWSNSILNKLMEKYQDDFKKD